MKHATFNSLCCARVYKCVYVSHPTTDLCVNAGIQSRVAFALVLGDHAVNLRAVRCVVVLVKQLCIVLWSE